VHVTRATIGRVLLGVGRHARSGARRDRTGASAAVAAPGCGSTRAADGVRARPPTPPTSRAHNRPAQASRLRRVDLQEQRLDQLPLLVAGAGGAPRGRRPTFITVDHPAEQRGHVSRTGTRPTKLSTQPTSTPLLFDLRRTAMTSISTVWINFGHSQSLSRRVPRNGFVGAPYPARAEPRRAQGEQSRVSTPLTSSSHTISLLVHGTHQRNRDLAAIFGRHVPVSAITRPAGRVDLELPPFGGRIQALLRVNVTCVTPLGEEMASTL
jgi:hypothetical protein